MTEKRHWNNLTKNYTEEIFDVFANDKKKLLAASFKKYANTKGTALDFGCGNGKAFQHLSWR